MLPDATVPASLLAVLGSLRGCFTYPGFSTFAALVTGLIANTGRGTVTGMLLGANLTRHWSHDRAHAFFARASWDAQTLGAALSHRVVRHLVPDGAPLTVAVDGTLSKRRGKKVFGACRQHDGSATGRDGIGYGTCFVVLGLIVELPFLTRPVCLPVAARLHRPKQGRTKVEPAASMVRFLAACHYARRIDVVADAAYHGRALRDLPGRVTLTTRLPASAVLYDLAPPPAGRRGRPRLKGERLGTPAELAAGCSFVPVTVHRYGRTDQVFVAEAVCLSGSRGTLLCPGPLRTVRAGWPRTRLKQALWLAGGQKCGPAAVHGGKPPPAVGVQESGGWRARSGGDDRLAGDRPPGRPQPLPSRR